MRLKKLTAYNTELEPTQRKNSTASPSTTLGSGVVSLEQLKRSVPCAVCQSPSSGRHYGVFTCGGCRNFFKRSITNCAQYKCYHSEEFVDYLKCKLCRYKACLGAGMSLQAVKIGRPTHNFKQYISDMVCAAKQNGGSLQQLHNAVVQSCSSNSTTNSIRIATRTLSQSSASSFSSSTTRSSQQQQQFEMFRQTICQAGYNFHQISSNENFENSFDFDWPLNEICLTIGKALEHDIGCVGQMLRSMPNFTSNVAIADRVAIFAMTLFPTLVCRSFSKVSTSTTYNNNNNNPLCYLFSIDQQSIPIVVSYFPDNFNRLSNRLAMLNFEFNALQLTEQEIFTIYALLFFNKFGLFQQKNNNNNSSLLDLEQIFLALNENFTESWPGRRNQIFKFVDKLEAVSNVMFQLVAEFVEIIGPNDDNSIVCLREIIQTNANLAG